MEIKVVLGQCAYKAIYRNVNMSLTPSMKVPDFFAILKRAKS